MLLDFPSASLMCEIVGGEAVSFPMNGCTQAEIFGRLFGYLVNHGLGLALPAGENLFERVLAGIAGKQGRYQPPQRGKLLDETPIEINPLPAQVYLRSLQEIFPGIALFKARLSGMQTPLVIWPHGLDLSTLWFAGTVVDERQFHMNFGFSPRSEGMDQSYLYAYAYPYPEGDIVPALPKGARWYIQGWKGMVRPDEVVAAQSNSARFVETICSKINAAFLAVKAK